MLVKAIYTSVTNHELKYRIIPGGSDTQIPGSVSGGVNALGETGSFDIGDNVAFAWTSGPSRYSLPSLNTGGYDQMVTFQVHGRWTDPDNQGEGFTALSNTYVIGFEDQVGSDADYQDFVCEVSNVVPIPEPLTVLGVFLGVGGLGNYIRKRREA